MEYLKINTLWKRVGCEPDADGKFVQKSDQPRKGTIVEGVYSDPAYHLLKFWEFEEKIDGTNIRVIFTRDNNGESRVTFGGRTNDAQIPASLIQMLMHKFPHERLVEKFPETGTVVLFGEGIGPKIGAGEQFRDYACFFMFDAYIDGWWLSRPNVNDIAGYFGVERPHYFGTETTENIVDFIKHKPRSYSSMKLCDMEGIVARTSEGLLTRKGEPLMWKLKIKDYKHVPSEWKLREYK